MRTEKSFIWLDSSLFPEYQTNTDNSKFCIAEFKKTIDAIYPIEIEITADTRYMLFVNDEYIGRGPVSAGQDFLFEKIDDIYFDTYSIKGTGKKEIKVLVTSVSTVLTENTYGIPGLWVGVKSLGFERWHSDESWDVRLLPSRKGELLTDYTEKEQEYHKARATASRLEPKKSPLSQLDEEDIYPIYFDKIVADANQTARAHLEFDKIYSAYPCISIKCDTKCTVKMTTSEMHGAGLIEEIIVTDKDVVHITPRMRAIDEMDIELVNQGDGRAEIDNVYITYTHYPVYIEAIFNTSDSLINNVYDLCMHTLKICRQTIHLDSPTHQEHLACTGDYYIQSMIEYFNLGDSTLAEFDIIRTANLIRAQKGRLFHTTYSLMYPWWVFDHYMHTGRDNIIELDVLDMLLNRFDGYVSSENGLLEYSPDYMFVDWVVSSCERDEFLDGGNMMSHGKMEGYSLHHPPKALGQSVLCMFYYNALVKSAQLYEIKNDSESAQKCRIKAEKIKHSINKHLFDEKRGLYVGGLNTPNLVEESQWLPKNTDTVYYLKQANTLAVLFGIAPVEKRRSILSYVAKDLSKLEMQPYFYHFLLNALYNEGMFGEYGMSIVRSYKDLLDKCPKGLSEAWDNMKCDYSHAWGATPAYSLKRALSGIELLEPAYKKIRISPQLFDLEFADFEITTPYGKIEICLKKGEPVLIKAPKQIEII
ncbi:MAG: hypothetical protein J6B29_02760 [Clostridia bacterium]|nr:hypothetical protein [Clostridia bacterium]